MASQQSEKEAMLARLATGCAHDDGALKHVSGELQNDKDVVLAAVALRGLALRFASKELQNNKDVALAAVAQSGDALFFVRERLRSDKTVVLAAVSQKGAALAHVSGELKNDPAVVLAAVAQSDTHKDPCGRSMHQDGWGKTAQDYAHLTLQASPELQRVAAIADAAERAAAATDPATVYKIDVEHRAIATLVGNIDLKPPRWPGDVREPTDETLERLDAAAGKVAGSQSAPMDVGGNRCPLPGPGWWAIPGGNLVAMEAMLARMAWEIMSGDHGRRGIGRLLEEIGASGELTGDKNFVLAAGAQMDVLQYASEELRSDRDFLLAAAQNGLAVPWISEELGNDKDFLLAAVAQSPDGLRAAVRIGGAREQHGLCGRRGGLKRGRAGAHFGRAPEQPSGCPGGCHPEQVRGAVRSPDAQGIAGAPTDRRHRGRRRARRRGR